MLQQVFEFSATSTGLLTFLVMDLLNLLVGASAANAGYFLIDTAKITMVQVWSIPSTNVFANLSLEWAGTRAPGVVTKSTTTPFNMRKVQKVPPSGSDVGDWQTSNEIANSLFQVQGSVQPYIVRIHTMYTISNVARSSGTPGTGATPNVTNFNRAATGSFVPTSTPLVATQFS